MVYLQELRNWAFLWELHFDSALNSLGLKWAITAKTKTSEGACPNQGVLIHKRLTVSVSGAENWGSHDCHPQESCPFPATLELPKPSSWQSRGPPALLQAFSLARARLNGSWETGPSLVVLIVKNPPAKAGEQEMWAGSMAWEDPLEEEMAMHSSILAWRNPWTEEPGGPQSIGSHRVRYNWSHLADARIRDLE